MQPHRIFPNSTYPILPHHTFTDISLQLPDSFKDFATVHVGGRGPGKALLRFCRQELFHAQLEILLDNDFLDAYVHGVLITCCDGVVRRIFPRIFTYSADYPEKFSFHFLSLVYIYQIII